MWQCAGSTLGWSPTRVFRLEPLSGGLAEAASPSDMAIQVLREYLLLYPKTVAVARDADLVVPPTPADWLWWGGVVDRQPVALFEVGRSRPALAVFEPISQNNALSSGCSCSFGRCFSTMRVIRKLWTPHPARGGPDDNP